MQKKYFLITTADELTWKFDRPVIFLGEWCRLYDRKHVWQNMDAIVAAPYGLGQAKKDEDHVEARVLEEQLFPILCEVLNRHHDSTHSARFWQIVLGHWFRRFVDAILNRVRTLEQCVHTHNLSGTMGFAEKGYTLAPIDSLAAIFAFNDDRWNNELNIRILNMMGEIDLPIERMAVCNETGFRWSELAQTSMPQRKLLSWARWFTGKITLQLKRDTDAFIINSYLPKMEEIKFQLALGQCPQFWTSPKLAISHRIDSLLRKRLTNELNGNSEGLLQRVLHSMLFELLPVCYLESFDAIKKIAHQQIWPKNPKFIFTSNNFDTDEVFKIWTASKIETGINYIVGQHGNYGVSRNHIEPSIEEITSNKFITWGWKDRLPQHTPAFIFTTGSGRVNTFDPSGGLLLIQLCVNHRITTWDVYSEFSDYFKDQQRLIRKLDNSVKKETIIRLHAGYRHMRWSEESRWREFDPALKIDTGCKPISELVAKSRLIVHSYDSTGILETLSQNIPTLAFWRNDFSHLRDSAKPYYQLLADAGIVHLSTESVVNQINMVWGDVGGWWAQRKVQDARRKFCERYAIVSKSPVKDLKKIFSTQSK